MGEPSSITTTGDPINIASQTGDILLGLLNAGGSSVGITATAGDILNNNGVFDDVTKSLTNIAAGSANLRALDRIGASSIDAVTFDVASNGSIILSFGADNAFINNLRNSRIVNNGAGEVIVGLIFSNQILGVGHNLGMSATHAKAYSAYFEEDYSAQKNNVSILGMDYLQTLDNEDEGFISSIIPSVPVMIRTLNGWRFEAPANQQKTGPDGQNNGSGLINWF